MLTLLQALDRRRSTARYPWFLAKEVVRFLEYSLCLFAFGRLWYFTWIFKGLKPTVERQSGVPAREVTKVKVWRAHLATVT